MEFSKGPRRLIFSNLAEKENKKLKDAPGVALLPGNIRIHSSSTPGLLHGVEYTAKFTQSISYPDLSNNKNTVSVPPLVSSKTFVVEGNPYYLDSALVNSVYPPPGNSDYSNVLPHVLFNDLQAPWSLEMPASDGQPLPCLGLLVFTEDELTLTPAQTQSLNTALGVNPPTTPAPTRTPTLAYNLAVRDLVTLRTAESSGVSGPVAFSAETATDASPVQVIFLQGSRFAGLFSTYQNGSAQPVAGTYPADLSRYRYMSHVRYFNASGIANKDNEPEVKVSATVSPRTGPLEITKPTTVFAHLISLPGVHENMRTDPSKVAALISLYSWSYTCLPASSFAVGKCFEVLGNSIQPLRSPDSFTSIPRSPATTADDWARNRLLGGFNLIRYRTPTGEITPAIHRGLLTPIKYPAVEFPPSDYGTDLAIIDESTGFLDLTFQLAWVLGRTSAMADRTLSAALMRLRTNVHNETLANAKKQLDSTLGLGFVDMSTTLSKLPTTFSGLTVRSTPATFTFIAQRWQKAALGTSTRSLLSFSNDSVQDSYKTILKPGISTFAAAVSSLQAAQATSPSLHTNPIEIYNEVNSPLSSDYATLLAWLMDRWFLQGLPMINLIPDPSFVPQESIRTFFVDQSWFRVFADGALSLSDHFNEDDDVRESIKASLDTYLGSNLKDINYPPQIPKWGFFLRSEVVLKFPDLRISAPRQDPNDPRAEVLRMEAIDQDLLIVLFDREPDTGAFPQGISIQPPEHQLSSMFGSIEGVVNNQLTQNWTKVYHDLTLPGKIPDPYGHPPLSTTFDLTDPVRNNGVFDCLNRSLCPYWFASIAQSTQKWAGNPPQNMISNSPALIASQLLAKVPRLTFADTSSRLQAGASVPNKLSTAKARRQPLTTTPLPTKLTAPPPVQATPTFLPIYSPPANPLFKALAKTDISLLVDHDVVQCVFPPLPKPPPSPFPPLVSAKPNKNTSGDSSKPPYLYTQIFNLRVPYQHILGQGVIDEIVPLVISPSPLKLGFTTDLHVSNISLAPSSRKLTSVDVIFTVAAAAPAGILAPFPNNPSAPPRPQNNSLGLWAPQPSFSGYRIPNVSFTGLGQRWLPKAAYQAPSGSTAGSFTVTLSANTGNPDATSPAQGLGAWDMAVYKDLSFVIEDVLLNEWSGYNIPATFTVAVNENYVDATQAVVQAKGQASVYVRNQDVTQSYLSFAPLGNTYTLAPPHNLPVQP